MHVQSVEPFLAAVDGVITEATYEVAAGLLTVTVAGKTKAIVFDGVGNPLPYARCLATRAVREIADTGAARGDRSIGTSQRSGG
jgi:hypothetical protein